MVTFVGVSDLRQLVQSQGPGPFMAGIMDCLEHDFRRWSDFDNPPRSASHSADGVIELMPTSDGQIYRFKFVNGHPVNTKSGKLGSSGAECRKPL